MARFEIISKDGSEVRFSGKPRYIGSYLKPSYIEFSEIASPSLIGWEVGDYVDYPRTGMRYRLYSIPQPSKNARKDSHGRAFVYSNVQFHAATKELEIALFRDLVSNDNNIHFSTSPDVATFEDVYGIARRIQACMDDLYPGRWEIRVAEFDEAEDADIIEKITTAKDFALSGGTCLDALSRIYELWQDIGWIHTHEDGKEIIIIGHANKRIDANTTNPFLYGKGNGLTAIKKNQTNKDEFATRLFVYGSERNLPSRYYNTKAILNAESVDIRNLMIPLDLWGKTDGLPDARKAYLENADAVAKYGVIPKVHYFDSEDAGADIHPSIKGMTIGNLRKALDAIGQTNYYPAYDIYPDDDERVDEILYADNPQDDGLIYKNGKKYLSTYDNPTSEQSGKTNTDVLVSSCVFELSEEAGPCELSIISDHSITLQDKDYSRVTVTVIVETAPVVTRMPLAEKTVEGTLEDGLWQINLPDFKVKGEDIKSDRYSFYVFLFVDAGNGEDPYTISSGTFSYRLSEIKASEFTIHLKQIGFDISHQASIGNGCKVAINTGACAGRSFVVSKCQSTTDGWLLTAKRQQDDSVGSLFPNQDYQIVSGDRFVLIDIAMPDIYITTAQDRLLNEGNKLLERASKIQNHYEPSIDAKVMAESGRTLREGMFMEITDEDVVDNTTDYILIDTLSIYEDESAIPTYKVTLRERRKVTYKGTPSVTTPTDTKPVSDDDDQSEYAKATDLIALSKFLESMWKIDSTGTLITDLPVHIKSNLIIDGDTASGGQGSNTPSVSEGTVTGVTVSGVDYTSVEAGLLDLTDLMANYALKSASTKVSVSPSLSSGKSIGVISVDGVGTTLYAPATYAWSEISGKPNALLFGGTSSQFLKADGSVDSRSYLPTSGGIITGDPACLTFRVPRIGADAWLQFTDTETSDIYAIGLRRPADMFGLQYRINSDYYYILHSGNVGTYALKTDGSNVMTGSLNFRTDTTLYRFANNSSGNASWYNGSVWKTLAFTDQVLLLNGSNAMAAGKYINWEGSNLNGEDYESFGYGIRLLSYDVASNNYRGGLSVGTRYGFQLTRLANADLNSLTVRFNAPNNNNAWGDWKTIAFTDSNVESAQALTHSNGTVGAIVNSSGNVTIGGSDLAGTNAKLSITGDVRIQNTTTTNGDSPKLYLSGIVNSDGNGATGPSLQAIFHGYYGRKRLAIFQHDADDYTTEREVASVLPNGNVGIGTTSPAYKLDVTGTGRFTDSLLVSGTLTANSGATITGDVTINGNLIVSGDVASGGQGQDTPSDGSTSTSGVLTLTGEIPEGSNIPQSSLDAIGLTDQVIADLLVGKYHHVIYTSGIMTYCFTVSGKYSSDYKALVLYWGDSEVNDFMGYSFASSANGWYIEFYEI